MNNTFIINKILFLILLSGYVYSQNCCEALEIAENECNGNTGCYIPQCTSDCNWEPMQCWGSTGYCWCVDESGIEIEGTSTPSWEGYPDCEEHIYECFDLTGIEFGFCDMYLGVGLLNDECNYISGCDWVIDGVDYSDLFFNSIDECQENCNSNQCEAGFSEINNLCFHQGDLGVIQKMIDNSYASNIELPCDEDSSPYCGSPNPYMDSTDSWMWVTVDGEYYEWNANANGLVEPLELGVQVWENGRLISLMCGAYIYCDLSGSIPEEINTLTETTVLRLEYNYLDGFIPETVCDLNANHSDYLEFDIVGNRLCPPYPECIYEGDFWYQDTSSCSEIGDINYDSVISVLDIITLVSMILNDIDLDYQTLIISDLNLDGTLDVLDIILIVDIILN